MLVEQHSTAAYRLALGIVRDHALAEDVVQETLVKVWRNLATFRGDAPLRAWVLRIAHNTAISTLRRQRDQVTDPAHLAVEPTLTDRPEAQLWREDLTRAMDALDPLSRSVVTLRELEDLTYEQIADTLDVPLSTVKTRLFRARRRLATELEEWR